MINFILNKDLKISNNNLILNFKKSTSYNNKYFNVIKIFNNLEYARLNIIINKKHIKYSHDRNRYKRIIKESFRINKYLLSLSDFIIFSKKKLNKLSNYKFIINLNKIWTFKNY
ncbi:MAG: ribonuclease P protein component [Enterobacteriaceae bacterium PC38]|nr:MAG: ribonuclease P protein component [Enterobacteriaceae bacterium PC38]